MNFHSAIRAGMGLSQKDLPYREAESFDQAPNRIKDKAVVAGRQ